MNQTSSESIAVIVPPVVCHDLDVHTGIPFMPHMAAYAAAALKQGGYTVEVVDCFGINSSIRQVIGEFMLIGVDEEEVLRRLSPQVKIVYIYCRTIAEFLAVERLIKRFKDLRPDIAICLFENVQAVTSFSLSCVAEDFLAKGCRAIILGEPERRLKSVTEAILHSQSLKGIEGIVYRENGETFYSTGETLDRDLNTLPFPDWEAFDLQGYWTAHFSHAPSGKQRFLPLLTSRGCPFRCTFCVSPSLNPVWRGRQPQNVVEEMEYFYREMNVTDFHISDLNPTVDENRIREMCREIIRRKLPVQWKLAQGTKIETIKQEDTLDLMAEAGCRYFSFSPESGSERMLQIMNKKFNFEHALRLARRMHLLGIKTQAVFLAGVPGEEKEDRKKTIRYAKSLILAGVDEISLVIFTPLPGAKLADSISGFDHFSQCTPSPNWRKDYRELNLFRLEMYIMLFTYKFRYPLKVIREIGSFFNKQFQTKMTMSLYKQIKLYRLRYLPNTFIHNKQLH